MLRSGLNRKTRSLVGLSATPISLKGTETGQSQIAPVL